MSEMAPDRSKVLSAHRTALVRIEVEGRNAEGRVAPTRCGTGVVVGANGVIVTAGHVVGKDADWAETPGGLRDRMVKVTGLDERGVSYSLGTAQVWHIPNHDVALLTVNAQGLQAAVLADQVPPDDASLVALLWEPGRVPEPVAADLVPTDQSRHSGLTIRIGVVEGNSGSGLFDAQLRLTGIILNQDGEHRALAIPAAWIKPTIKPRIGPTIKPRIGQEELQPPTPSDTSTIAQLAGLVDALMGCPKLAAEAGRNDVLAEVRPEIVHAVQRRGDTRSDLTNIVRTAARYNGGLEDFLQVVERYERGTINWQQVDQYVARTLPHLRINRPPTS
jgi:hypothetical protein